MAEFPRGFIYCILWFFQMMISVFREDEIRCWADMSDSGYVPSLYLFRIEDNKVSIHMEILKKGNLNL